MTVLINYGPSDDKLDLRSSNLSGDGLATCRPMTSEHGPHRNPVGIGGFSHWTDDE